MTTPRRGLLFHFTHIDNLDSILTSGLRSDTAVRAAGHLGVEIGESRIKTQRRDRPVPIPPGGVVADYVPFYFAARSPMLFTIHCGNVEAYQGGRDQIIYLLSDLARLSSGDCEFVFTDRNAYYTTARYESDQNLIDEVVDWDLMEATTWNNTVEEPDRMELRMAELLVHNDVPITAIHGIAVKTDSMLGQVETAIARLATPPTVAVAPEWYF